MSTGPAGYLEQITSESFGHSLVSSSFSAICVVSEHRGQLPEIIAGALSLWPWTGIGRSWSRLCIRRLHQGYHRYDRSSR